ncbi:unnamed protein product [Rangifer tarandus platyrhynchus]|uniref:Uncharacterized protein n=2 Tax=Rangifer tarandus platyrhynchus TaxID=3082113 RepID=A0ABN8ZL54_RANTA|nr:unnamed protein product [Rangifer tarandus platyrhynchus]CAI9706703.1 unnamed protein product [Rangifer tarandus platyrhynchus]
MQGEGGAGRGCALGVSVCVGGGVLTPFPLPFLPASSLAKFGGGPPGPFLVPFLVPFLAPGLEIELSACPALKGSERAGGERPGGSEKHASWKWVKRKERVYENKCGGECLRSRACPGKASGRQV